MNPKVRDLYKRFLMAGHVYPQGLDFVRAKAKVAFFKNENLTDELEVKKAIAKGRWWVKELTAIGALHKYRSLKKRYNS
jgi:hypothetical protein